MEVRVETNSREQMDRFVDELRNKVTPRATRKAMNRTVSQVKTRTARKAAAALGFKVGAVRGRLKILKATTAKPYRSKLITLTLSMPASKIGNVRRARGQAKAGKLTFPPPSFVATMPSGFTSVFKRREIGRPRRPPKYSGLPIEEASIPIALELNTQAKRTLDNDSPKLWIRNMEQALAFELARAEGRV